MIEFSQLTTFTRVVELGSLTRAARVLGVPKSTISRKISRLEEHLGTQLLRRSSHSVTVTEQGLIFFEFSLRCLGVLRDGEHAVQRQHNRPRGVIRVALPASLDRAIISPLLAGFLDAYPDVRLVSAVVDDEIDLLRDGFDLGIVAGALPSAQSSVIASKLGASAFRLYAAPSYLERNGAPQSQLDLPRFDLLAWGAVDVRAHWDLHTATQQVRVEFRPRMICNDLALLVEAVLCGLGIAALPTSVCDEDVRGRRLVEVLSDWQIPGATYYAVYPQQHDIPIRVRAFLDFMADHLRPKLLRV